MHRRERIARARGVSKLAGSLNIRSCTRLVACKFDAWALNTKAASLGTLGMGRALGKMHGGASNTRKCLLFGCGLRVADPMFVVLFMS